MKTEPKKEKGVKKPKRKREDLAQMTVGEAAKTPRFWLLWFMMFINISSGIMLISVASPIAQDKVGMPWQWPLPLWRLWASLMDLAVFSGPAFPTIFGPGKTCFSFSSRFKRSYSSLCRILADPVLFQIFLYIIVSMYGGGFSCLPAFIGDIFGTKQLGAIHGCILTAWSCAGVFGPMMVSAILDATSSYNMTFYVFTVLLALAFGTAVLMKLNIKKVHSKNNSK